jgi:hypothetical protein
MCNSLRPRYPYGLAGHYLQSRRIAWTKAETPFSALAIPVMIPPVAGPHDSLEVEQPGGRTDKNGQFVLAVDPSQNNPEDLFEQAQSAEDAGDVAEAERLYRVLMKTDPTDASAPFNLGNLFWVSARNRWH